MADSKTTLQALIDENAALTLQVVFWKARALTPEQAGNIKRDPAPLKEFRAAVQARVEQIMEEVGKQLANRPNKHFPTFTMKLPPTLAFDEKSESLLASKLLMQIQGTFACKVVPSNSNAGAWNKNHVDTLTLSFE